LKALAKLVKTVEVADRFADGLATAQALNAVHIAASGVLGYVMEPVAHQGDQLLAWAATEISQPGAYDAALAVRKGLVEIGVGSDVEKQFPGALKSGCNFLRDIVGNPFRPSPDIDSALLSWNDGSVPRRARAIYDHRNFERLPVLADALADAGCDHADMLKHCRHPGPHVRGCWVVDLLLAQESNVIPKGHS
jgi:hypothetical protein